MTATRSMTRGRPSGRPPKERPLPRSDSPSATDALIVGQRGRKRRQAGRPRVLAVYAPERYRVADLPGYIAIRITVHPVSGCWIIGGSLDKDGYARIGDEGAHRVVYKLLAGEIPPDRPQLDPVVKVGCISRACCWPTHLEPVTARTNTLRGVSFAAVNAAKAECDHGHSYDLFNMYYRPDGHRDCRTCIRAHVRKYKQRRKHLSEAGGAASERAA